MALAEPADAADALLDLHRVASTPADRRPYWAPKCPAMEVYPEGFEATQDYSKPYQALLYLLAFVISSTALRIRASTVSKSSDSEATPT